jgi:hypothetical protein
MSWPSYCTASYTARVPPRASEWKLIIKLFFNNVLNVDVAWRMNFVSLYVHTVSWNFYCTFQHKVPKLSSTTGRKPQQIWAGYRLWIWIRTHYTTERQKMWVIAFLYLIEDTLGQESTFISPSISAQTRGCNKSQNALPPVRHVLTICGNQGQGQTNICIITWFTSSFDL